MTKEDDDLVILERAEVSLTSHDVLAVPERGQKGEGLPSYEPSTVIREMLPITSLAASCHGEEHPLRERRPALIDVTAFKLTSSEPVGLELVSDNDDLVISYIEPSSLLGQTMLRQGDIIYSINYICCRGRDPEFAYHILRRAIRTVHIVVCAPSGDPYLVSITITKPTPISSCGITFKKDENNHLLIVESIDCSGPFVNTLLNIGDRLLEVEGYDSLYLTPAVADALLGHCKTTVTLITSPEACGVLATMTAMPSRDEKKKRAKKSCWRKILFAR